MPVDLSQFIDGGLILVVVADGGAPENRPILWELAAESG